MAIKMVREPSDTPNINNIDDIIPMRYAYGGQNGYVIGKGTEISNTVNGSNFIVNSGRLVLQGVECDIDASGVTIAVDNIATKRYYVVYLQVNLATNQVTIDSTYDTADYPVINSGDDLTENSSGIARLALYKFSALNGVISDVEKVIYKIDYSREFTETLINSKIIKLFESYSAENEEILQFEENLNIFGSKNKSGVLFIIAEVYVNGIVLSATTSIVLSSDYSSTLTFSRSLVGWDKNNNENPIIAVNFKGIVSNTNIKFFDFEYLNTSIPIRKSIGISRILFLPNDKFS